MSNRIQTMGKFMSKMILPNISAFIIWGFITALFMPTGWLPNESLALLIKPMAKYLLPILIAYSGGRLVYESRGGVIGAAVTFGLIVGSNVPMFAGAMIVGPIAAYFLKKIDKIIEEKIPSGFEMLINNFSAGILGLLLTMMAFTIIGPILNTLNEITATGLRFLIEQHIIPFAAIIIEPAKVLFLNNIINHGILSPMGLLETTESGKSLLFLLETNPGPGLGILAAYWGFGNGVRKHTAPGAMIIHFFGGIHEVYFPFVLANPLTIVAVIMGGISGNVIFQIFNVGLTSTPSPGSILSILALTSRGDQLGVVLGVLISAGVSYFFASILIQDKKVLSEEASEKDLKLKLDDDIRCIAFACDAGMGSSAMAAKHFERAIGKASSIKVLHCPVDEIPSEVDLLITHNSLAGRLVKSSTLKIVYVDDFMNSSVIHTMIERYKNVGGKDMLFKQKDNSILNEDRIFTGLDSEEKFAAINRAGEALLAQGLVEADYIPAMAAREKIATTYIGSSVAIPHGTKDAKANVLKTGIVFLQYPNGVDFGDGNIAKLVIGIAAAGDEHMDILMKIAEAVSNNDTLEFLSQEPDRQKIFETFVKNGLGGQS